MSLLKDLKHANIVTLHDIVHTPKSLTLVFEYLVSSTILSSACKTGITFFALLNARLLGDPTQTSLLFSLLAPRFINVTPGTYKYFIAFYWVVLFPNWNCCFVVQLGKRSEAIHGWLWRNNEYEQRQSKWKGFISFFLTSAKFAARQQFYRFSHAVQWVAKVSARSTNFRISSITFIYLLLLLLWVVEWFK